jgi:GT2 family glycosyltransferase
MKIAVTMAYYNREKLLQRTLATIAQSACKSTEVCIVDDASNPPLAWPEVRRTFTAREKFWKSPAVPFNAAIQEGLRTGADVLLMQSPECYHVGDVLSYVREHMRPGVYMTFACLSLSKDDTEDPDTYGREEQIGVASPWDTCSNSKTGWYNHSIHRPCHLEFCAAVHRNDVMKLNGYDERFADGVACEDADFLRRVKVFGLELRIVDSPFVVHQWHYSGPDVYADEPRFKRNVNLGAKLAITEASNYRAMHLFTEDFDAHPCWRAALLQMEETSPTT